MRRPVKYKNAFKSEAFKSANSLGRKHKNGDEEFLPYGALDPFELDIHKIISSKSYRFLAGKTQVWPLSQNPLVRNRLSHTSEVEAIASIISGVLGLNVSLTRAIALAHDLGHAPFGHLFEKTISSTPQFLHECFGPILLQQIERKGFGINLSFEVLEGVFRHPISNRELVLSRKLPWEYLVVMYADKLAYVFSDLNDCARQKYIKIVPPKILKIFGKNQRERLNSCLLALFEESFAHGYVSFQYSEKAMAFSELRRWMHKNVYFKFDQEEIQLEHAKNIRSARLVLEEYLHLDRTTAIVVLATMTDRELLRLSSVETTGDIMELSQMGFMEYLPYCQNIGFEEKNIDFSWAKK